MKTADRLSSLSDRPLTCIWLRHYTHASAYIVPVKEDYVKTWSYTAALLLSASVTFAGTTPSMGSVLTSDGEFMEGTSESCDPATFRMEYGPDGEPLFVGDGSLPCEPVPWPDGQDLEGAWYPLGSGLDNTVFGITVNGSDVYVGGSFTHAGGNPASHIARWDGSSWSALGSGVNGGVYAVDYSDTGVLYMGGSFTQVGGSPINRIASWNGTSWSWLGSGVNDCVWACATNGSDVYVGGDFTEAGGIPANYIARWNGVSWSALGSGLNDPVEAIAVNGSEVYAGGSFTQAGGSPANRIARWDGSSWSALGSGVSGSVHAITLSDSDVYVGGWFSEAGWSPADNIACWNGSSWSALGYGVSSSVFAIALSGSDLYAGGAFTMAGGIPANFIARWEPDSTGIEPSPDLEPSALHASPNPTTVGVELYLQNTGISPLTLEIYDAAGRLVRMQDLGSLPTGSQTHYWDGLDGNGNALTQGVYFLRLSSADLEASTRVVLLR